MHDSAPGPTVTVLPSVVTPVSSPPAVSAPRPRALEPPAHLTSGTGTPIDVRNYGESPEPGIHPTVSTRGNGYRYETTGGHPVPGEPRASGYHMHTTAPHPAVPSSPWASGTGYHTTGLPVPSSHDHWVRGSRTAVVDSESPSHRQSPVAAAYGYLYAHNLQQQRFESRRREEAMRREEAETNRTLQMNFLHAMGVPPFF